MVVRLTTRLLLGAIAGIAGTVAMTAAMNRLHPRLPPSDQYPLSPREITERLVPIERDDAIKDAATAAHHGYGAAAGALLAAAQPTMTARSGSTAGVAIWAASYFGWIPAMGVLRPAHRHPPARSALMIAAHLVWGAVTAASYRELAAARHTTLRDGPVADAPSTGDNP
jgi:hypothetical protein